MNERRTNGAAQPVEAKRVAIYTRKSTDKGLERDFNSLDAQREACEQYIKSQAHLGWKLVDDRYDDGGFTGANIDRPAFARLLEDIDAGRVDVVVVYKVDRLSRSLLDFAKVMDRFNQAGAAFVSVTQNFSTADAMGRLTLNVLMSFAEFEREMIAERTRDKIAAARRRGKWTGGPVPLGYRVEDKKLVVVESEAQLVRDIFSLYLERRSALAVAQRLNETHRQTKQHTSKKGRLRPGHGWGKDAVLRILKNPVYAGLMPYGDETHDGEHEAIIDRATFRRVAAALERPVDKGGRRQNPEYLLRGLLRCAHCGLAMTPASTTKPGGQTYRYYRCITKDKHGKSACESRPLPASAIEGYVVERIREATADGSLARDVVKQIDAYVATSRKKLLDERKDLPTQIASLSAEAKKLLHTMSGVNEAARRLIEERMEQVGQSITVAESRLAEVERALSGLDEMQAEARWVSEALGNFDAVWDAMTIANRSRMVRAVVRRVEIKESTGEVTTVLNDLNAGELGGSHRGSEHLEPPMEASA